MTKQIKIKVNGKTIVRELTAVGIKPLESPAQRLVRIALEDSRSLLGSL